MKSCDAYRCGWLSVIPRGAVRDSQHVPVQPGVGLRVGRLAPELGPYRSGKSGRVSSRVVLTW